MFSLIASEIVPLSARILLLGKLTRHVLLPSEESISILLNRREEANVSCVTMTMVCAGCTSNESGSICTLNVLRQLKHFNFTLEGGGEVLPGEDFVLYVKFYLEAHFESGIITRPPPKSRDLI